MSDTSDDHRRGGGPKTEEGKNRVSLNALKHGMSAKSPQAVAAVNQQCESEELFQKTLSEMNDHYRPADPIERQLVRRIALCLWRLQSTEVIERRMIIREGKRHMPDYVVAALVSVERFTDLHLHRAMRALERKRAAEKQVNSRTNSIQAEAEREFGP